MTHKSAMIMQHNANHGRLYTTKLLIETIHGVSWNFHSQTDCHWLHQTMIFASSPHRRYILWIVAKTSSLVVCWIPRAEPAWASHPGPLLQPKTKTEFGNKSYAHKKSTGLCLNTGTSLRGHVPCSTNRRVLYSSIIRSSVYCYFSFFIL